MRRVIPLVVALLALTAPIARADHLSRNQEQHGRQVGTLCRWTSEGDGQTDECSTYDGYDLSEANVQAYEASWVHRAIALQRQLDEHAPLRDELLPHTHNSFNSEAYTPTVSRNDPNQLLSLTDQLRLDMRAVEIDVHRSVSVEDGSIGVVACHANENEVPVAGVHVHVGCTTEDPLVDYLTELNTWLRAPENADQFVMLYLENALEGDPVAHDLAAAAIEETIGDLVYKTSTPCEDMPYDTSRADLRPARVLIVGNCGPGAWGTYVHDRGSRWDESSNPAGDQYTCDERDGDDYDGKITRRYEDRTWLSAMVDTSGDGGGITKAEMAEMVRCGVNLVGFDLLHPDDERLETLVWSWAVDEPSAPGSAVQSGTTGRWSTAPCGELHRAACLTDGEWTVTAEPVTFAAAKTTCGFAAPWNGWQNDRLRLAAAGEPVWVRWSSDPEVPAE